MAQAVTAGVLAEITGSERVELSGRLETLLAGCAGWSVATDRTWARARFEGARTPAQGWKLHLSATMLTAGDVLRAALPVLVRTGTEFKIASTYRGLQFLTGTTCPRGNAGKFLTAYPVDADTAVALALELDAVCEGLTGPRVLTDRPLRPGSVVHYRYGAFTGHPLFEHDGTLSSALLDPSGNPVPDRRDPGYFAPPFAVNPFPAAVPVREHCESVQVGVRYVVREAIRHSAKGGVFRATDTETGATVILKQARAHVGTTEDGADVRDLLRHEYAVLRRLEDTGWTPRPVAVFEESGDAFLVEEDLSGRTLRSWVAAGTRDGLVARPRRESHAVLRQCAQLLADLHARGLVVRDLTPNNLLVSDEGRVRLVDVELCLLPEQPRTVHRAGTMGYASPDQFDSPTAKPDHDLYALGALVVHVLTGQDPLPGDTTTMAEWVDDGVRRAQCGPALAELAAALQDLPDGRRPSAADAVRVVDRADVLTPPVTALDELAHASEGLRALSTREVDEAISALTERLLDDLDPAARRLTPTTAFGESTLPSNVQHGAAGVVGVLAQLVAADDDDRVRDALASAAAWLDRASRDLPPGGPVGLYFGTAGIAWALVDAGRALGDTRLVARGVESALRIDRDFPGPDLTHGLAGLGLTLAHLWRRTGDPACLSAVREVADTLLDTAVRDAVGISWRTPSHVPSAFAGKRFWGLAHGTAGIGLFLAEAAATCGDDRYADACAEAVASLRAGAQVRDGRALWGSGPDEPGAGLGLWCNGSAGVLAFLLRAPRVASDDPLLEQAALGAFTGALRNTGVSYCHGLSGNADILLEAAEVTGSTVLCGWAQDLLAAMWSRRRTDDRGVVLSDEPGRAGADFNIGYGGPLSVLVRMRHGGSRLWMPTTERPVTADRRRPSPVELLAVAGMGLAR